jgi:hypothetical protein
MNVQMKKQVQSLRKEGAANSSQFEKTNNKTTATTAVTPQIRFNTVLR